MKSRRTSSLCLVRSMQHLFETLTLNFLYQQIDIQAIEKVQHRAARRVMPDYNRTSSVSIMLETLNWPTLKGLNQGIRISRLHTFYMGIHNLSDLHIPSYPSTRHHPLTTLSIQVLKPVTINTRSIQEQLSTGITCD